MAESLIIVLDAMMVQLKYERDPLTFSCLAGPCRHSSNAHLWPDAAFMGTCTVHAIGCSQMRCCKLRPVEQHTDHTDYADHEHRNADGGMHNAQRTHSVDNRCCLRTYRALWCIGYSVTASALDGIMTHCGVLAIYFFTGGCWSWPGGCG